ncbi:MAG: type II toxin-antitoxin system VapC family toxin, partial [Planctomycetaceae bacterium]|nr:type II toxin-antitoxin system VapC family toxin [Planctomycetaceae bacterium]
MRLLVDTHALLWLITGDARLSQTARAMFLEPVNELFLSAASYWEICIKVSIGKLTLMSDWPDVIDRE